jgi:3-oxoacyl-(acyl-carrier-protein) synthase
MRSSTVERKLVRRRVAITGCGVVCALGDSFAEFAAALRAGHSGIALWGQDRDESVPFCPAARPRRQGYDPDARSCRESECGIFALERVWLDPVSHYALHASNEALDQSGLLQNADLRRNMAVYLGTAMGGARTSEESFRTILCDDAFPKPLAILCAMSNAPAGQISIRYGCTGANLTFSVACASSALALGEAYLAVRSGRLDFALAAGAEACITPSVIRAWQSMRVLAPANFHQPSASCRPFSRDRAGIVLGEGAAAFVLEPLDTAVHRGAPVLAEILGFGACSDASHLCIPSVEGQAAAMIGALMDAQLTRADIGYLNAHGTGTRVGDATETRAIHRVFGPYARELAVSSTKSAHGHLLGASGALEFAAGLAALIGGFVPATLHLSEADPECDLDYVANQPRCGVDVRRFLSNSFAFGGSNAVLIAGRPE